jgi:hypothetical protein
MQRTCANAWCKKPFEVSDAELALLDKISPVIGKKQYSIPPPTLCFSCRRLAFYNCRSLYRRKCDQSGKTIISTFSPDKRFTVYDKEYWFSDKWDPLAYGVDPDFNQPFFPQIKSLLRRVPLQSIAIIGPDNINSDYTNDNYKLKNCYLVFDGEQAEDSFYGQTFTKIRSCSDFVSLWNSELCYECVHCQSCYHLFHSRYCFNCSDSWFLRDCIGCKNCIGCANLRQKQYCIFNEQRTKQEYEAFMREFRTSSHQAVQTLREKAEKIFLSCAVKAMRGEQNINVSGDNLFQCKDAHMCFDCNEQQDTLYCTDCGMSTKDSQDIHIWGDGLELSYNCCCVGAGSRNLLCNYYVSQSSSDIYYSIYCSLSVSHLIGCVGLRHKKYCILNKQYTQEEYERLAGRLISHMQATGEWGEFFPPDTALYGYNETMAQTFFPLERDIAAAHGFLWSDYETSVEAKHIIDATDLPDDSSEIPDDILNWAVRCEVSGKPYKIVAQELGFYRNQRLPVPRRHPDQRHADRYALKNPYTLFHRTCLECGKDMETTYAPERPEKVYCEGCYLKEVY